MLLYQPDQALLLFQDQLQKLLLSLLLLALSQASVQTHLLHVQSLQQHLVRHQYQQLLRHLLKGY